MFAEDERRSPGKSKPAEYMIFPGRVNGKNDRRSFVPLDRGVADPDTVFQTVEQIREKFDGIPENGG
jgi:hypothetical protein